MGKKSGFYTSPGPLLRPVFHYYRAKLYYLQTDRSPSPFWRYRLNRAHEAFEYAFTVDTTAFNLPTTSCLQQFVGQGEKWILGKMPSSFFNLIFILISYYRPAIIVSFL